MTSSFREGTVKANGIEFAYLEQGSGPLVLLMHGFPDNAYTWEYQIPVLAEAGYRAVAPFLRGYPPTEIPEGGFFDALTLATDARELIRELGGGEPAFYMGTDWGTLIGFTLMQVYPEVVRRAVVMAVPLPQAAAEILFMPELLHHTFHVWFHQMPHIPEAAIAANDYAYVDYLWRFWEPGHEDHEHVARVKRTLAGDGALSAALAYYRATFGRAPADPALESLRGRLGGAIGVPTMAIFGREDPLAVFADNHAQFFSGEFRLELTDGGQHFIHRSRPKAVNELILSWIGTGT